MRNDQKSPVYRTKPEQIKWPRPAPLRPGCRDNEQKVNTKLMMFDVLTFLFLLSSSFSLSLLHLLVALVALGVTWGWYPKARWHLTGIRSHFYLSSSLTPALAVIFAFLAAPVLNHTHAYHSQLHCASILITASVNLLLLDHTFVHFVSGIQSNKFNCFNFRILSFVCLARLDCFTEKSVYFSF